MDNLKKIILFIHFITIKVFNIFLYVYLNVSTIY